LESFAAAGLYESVPNVSPQELEAAIRQVWASLWTRRAAESRRTANLRHEEAHMAVLIQEFFDPEFAFVLHTVDPAAPDTRFLYAELVVGLGETLVSAASAGTPYRLKCQKPDGPAKILAFANFSHALRLEPGAGLRKETLDYSQVRLSRDFAALAELGNRLAKVGTNVERALGGPQDIEGFVSNDDFYLVQARPQQGLSRAMVA
jgi:phosphoglucan,water dikinase